MSKLGVIGAALVAIVAGMTTAQAAPAGAGLKAPLAGLPILQTQARRRCVAIGVTRRGRRIPGVRGVAQGLFGRPTCRRALRRCRADLRARQRRGLNPFGRCIIR
jgi:hypothetical protein